MTAEIEVGPYRGDLIPGTNVWVSTILRESSAVGHHSPYFETMVFSNEPGIVWQSAAGFQREADRQHDLAVRWFSRKAEGVDHVPRPSLTAPKVSSGSVTGSVVATDGDGNG